MTRRLFFALTTALLGPPALAAEPGPVRVVVWDEQQPAQKEAYPNFLGNEIASFLAKQPGVTVKSVRLDDPEQGLSKETLDSCDVLLWWGHVRHADVKPETVKAVIDRVKAGKLSLIALHSAHWSKPFVEAMSERARTDAAAKLKADGLSGVPVREVPPRLGVIPRPTDPVTPYLEIRGEGAARTAVLHLPGCIFPGVRNDGKTSHVTVLDPEHPLTKGLPRRFDIPQTEMYPDPFHVPKPDVVVFEEKWDLGESFRSGSVWKVGKGQVIYFRPGHETYPVFKQPEVQTFLVNAVRWLVNPDVGNTK